MTITPGTFSRRAILGGLLAAPFIIRPAEAASLARGLTMKHLHTQETISATYWRNGKYDLGAWKELNQFLRDWRTDGVVAIDLRTLDTIHRICEKMGAPKSVEIICGYRSPKTNAMLRSKSSGVAKKSYHVIGKAVDFRLPNQGLRATHRAAVSLKTGGIGLYSRSRFIHVDSGPVRSWGK
jgi:uncharacterized protein YcbK (DUF882 family)